jgi:hypothetical protein
VITSHRKQGAALAALFLAGAPALAQPASPIARIERAFVESPDLELVHEIKNLPPDVVEAFRSLAHWERMAEWGQDWNSTDAIEGNEPLSQHVFSAVSATLAVVVFQSGGQARTTNVLVAERGQPGLCHYRIGDALPRSIGSLRAAVRNKSYHFNGVSMQCAYRRNDADGNAQ